MKDYFNLDLMRSDTKRRAAEFVNANDLDKVWYVGGEIVNSAIIFDVWDENIKLVCEYQIENGMLYQPMMGEFLIDRNS